MKELTTVGSNALILETSEDEVLDREASLIERRAEGVPVTNDVEFASAGGLLKEIKQMQKKVKEYWEPLRVKAKAAYDDVLSRPYAGRSHAYAGTSGDGAQAGRGCGGGSRR